MVESQSTAFTTWLHPPEIGADSGNRTRTSCLEGKGTTTMQYPHFFIIFYNKSILHSLQAPGFAVGLSTLQSLLKSCNACIVSSAKFWQANIVSRAQI